MATATDALRLARAWIGYREKSNKHNFFGKWYGMNQAPWCAMFVSYCLAEVGIELNIEKPKGFAYCPAATNFYRRKGLLRKESPRVGDIVLFDWGRDGISDHTGLVFDVQGQNIVCIEGNTSSASNSNGGTVSQRTRNRSLIQGFITPPYNGQSIKAMALGVPAFTGKPIDVGDSSNEVIVWRSQMEKRGWKVGEYKGTKFSPKDRENLIAFQREMGLDADGVLGLQSWLGAFTQPIT